MYCCIICLQKQESEWLEMKVSAHPISSLNLLADNVTVVYVTGSASNEVSLEYYCLLPTIIIVCSH